MRNSRVVPILLVVFQLLFLAAQGQNITTDKVTLGLKDDSLETAIKKIEQQSAFRFFYRDADIKPLTHLDLTLATRTIEQTLEALLQNTRLSFRQIGDHILLQYKERPTSCQISGRIVNAADQKPVANASVFLSNATIGNMTADDGTFTLTNIKPGEYELVVSSVGFETYRRAVTADNDNIVLPAIGIDNQTILLDEVRVNSIYDPDRERNYEWFKAQFLGSSKLAGECKILNPETLDLDYNSAVNVLTASSVDFLKIENNALGYQIKYLLTNFIKNDTNKNAKDVQFGGPAFFEEMRGKPSEEKRWRKRRQGVYEGSVMHFLRSVLNNSFEEEGFRVLQIADTPNPERPPDSLINAKMKLYETLKHKNRRYRDTLAYWETRLSLPKTFKTLGKSPLKQADMIRLTNQKGLYALTSNGGALYVIYNKNHHFASNNKLNNLDDPGNDGKTIINFEVPYVLFDKNGCIMDPTCVSFEGAWGKNRVAELLPVDYNPYNL